MTRLSPECQKYVMLAHQTRFRPAACHAGGRGFEPSPPVEAWTALNGCAASAGGYEEQKEERAVHGAC